MMKRNTLDLDFNDTDKMRMIQKKIRYHCPDVEYTLHRSPSMNGWHIILYCTKECEMCRMVFDDQTRFMLDQERSVAEQNVLFDKKTYKKMNTHIVLASGKIGK